MVKQCPECGEQLPENAKFCMNCGYNFDIDKSVKKPYDIPIRREA